MVPLQLLFQMPAIRVFSSERSLLLSGRTVLPQENWKKEEERRGEGKEKKKFCIVQEQLGLSGKWNWLLMICG